MWDSIREALRILEAQGLVETHAGRHGGSVVSRPSDHLFAQQIDSYAKTHGLSISVFTGLLFVALIPAIYVGILSLMFDNDRVEVE